MKFEKLNSLPPKLVSQGSRKASARWQILAFVCIWILVFLRQNSKANKTATYTIGEQQLKGIEIFLKPETSTRHNFGVLFERVLHDAQKKKGNFLEIGGGSGSFFDHNMATFGHMIQNYVIIEPYSLISETKERLPAFAEKVYKWRNNSSSPTSVTVHDEFSTNLELIKSFPDEYFDFVYIDGDHSYKGAKSDLINYFRKVRSGGVIAGHDYCCNRKEYESTIHAPWCGKYIYPDSTSNREKHGKDKQAFCGIFLGAEEFAKENNFYWLYTLEGRGKGNSAGTNNPSYFTLKY